MAGNHTGTADALAKQVFIITMISSGLYILAVFVFVLN
jgi:hypothetical protein